MQAGRPKRKFVRRPGKIQDEFNSDQSLWENSDRTRSLSSNSSRRDTETRHSQGPNNRRHSTPNRSLPRVDMATPENTMTKPRISRTTPQVVAHSNNESSEENRSPSPPSRKQLYRAANNDEFNGEWAIRTHKNKIISSTRIDDTISAVADINLSQTFADETTTTPAVNNSSNKLKSKNGRATRNMSGSVVENSVPKFVEKDLVNQSIDSGDWNTVPFEEEGSFAISAPAADAHDATIRNEISATSLRTRVSRSVHRDTSDRCPTGSMHDDSPPESTHDNFLSESSSGKCLPESSSGRCPSESTHDDLPPESIHDSCLLETTSEVKVTLKKPNQVSISDKSSEEGRLTRSALRKKSRYSVYDASLPSKSLADAVHYAEITEHGKSPVPTRPKFVTLRGKKLYTPPKLIRPYVSPGSQHLRRSKRTRVPRLRESEGIIYRIDKETGAYVVAGIQHSDIENDFLFSHAKALDDRKKKAKQRQKQTKLGLRKTRTVDKSIHLNDEDAADACFSDGEASVFDVDANCEVKKVIANTREEVVYHELTGHVADDDTDVKVAKFLQDDRMSCGEIILRGFATKPPSLARGFSVIFHVVEGAVLAVLNDKHKQVVKDRCWFMVPNGNSYTIKNLRESDALITFTTSKMDG